MTILYYGHSFFLSYTVHFVTMQHNFLSHAFTIPGLQHQQKHQNTGVLPGNVYHSTASQRTTIRSNPPGCAGKERQRIFPCGKFLPLVAVQLPDLNHTVTEHPAYGIFKCNLCPYCDFM